VQVVNVCFIAVSLQWT